MPSAALNAERCHLCLAGACRAVLVCRCDVGERFVTLRVLDDAHRWPQQWQRRRRRQRSRQSLRFTVVVATNRIAYTYAIACGGTSWRGHGDFMSTCCHTRVLVGAHSLCAFLAVDSCVERQISSMYTEIKLGQEDDNEYAWMH
ncbi:hypothetical protein JKP88DRAFT_240571 [Tribonema minus]|uniref:Uncharacterized protein n=1 Tax=Tribonema minus TaxID=303371 RepID=A0A836CRG2_9STRA|nr:hypothetical protein JKP88DRAFT_240571 [Tribonema minus]